MKNLAIYYRTMRNSAIRKLDLKSIRFDKVKYQTALLDVSKDQPITMVKVK